jgi:hypothetical protein
MRMIIEHWDGYAGEFYRRFRYPAIPLSGGYMPINPVPASIQNFNKPI